MSLHDQDARDASDAFLSSLYGDTLYKKWKLQKKLKGFTYESEFVKWLLDVVNTHESKCTPHKTPLPPAPADKTWERGRKRSRSRSPSRHSRDRGRHDARSHSRSRSGDSEIELIDLGLQPTIEADVRKTEKGVPSVPPVSPQRTPQPVPPPPAPVLAPPLHLKSALKQPAKPFTQPAQPTPTLNQPVQQFTQPNQQFTQPNQQFTKPNQQFAQPIQPMPPFLEPTQPFPVRPANPASQSFTQGKQLASSFVPTTVSLGPTYSAVQVPTPTSQPGERYTSHEQSSSQSADRYRPHDQVRNQSADRYRQHQQSSNQSGDRYGSRDQARNQSGERYRSRDPGSNQSAAERKYEAVSVVEKSKQIISDILTHGKPQQMPVKTTPEAAATTKTGSKQVMDSKLLGVKMRLSAAKQTAIASTQKRFYF